MKDSPSGSRFLDLPPEIRNSIYRFCLVNGDVVITKDLQAPALLSTCRQIRCETLQLWYVANKFKIRIENCDTTLYEAYYRNAVVPQGNGIRRKWHVFVSLRGVGWDNLVEWCRKVAENKLPKGRKGVDGTACWALVIAATTIAYESRTLGWATIERQLEVLRPLAGNLDQRWLS